MDDDSGLYLITLRATPLPRHPMYYEVQFAYVHFWLYSDSSDNAIDAARNSLEALSFSLADSRAEIARPDPESGYDHPLYAGGLRDCLASGFSFRVLAVETGADEPKDWDMLR